VNNFTRTLAKERAPTVRVNAIAPRFVATSYLDYVSEELKASWLEAIPLKRSDHPTAAAAALPATRPENRHPPRKVPSKEL
jgi:NAD(P)-dependent dehydrogenase (short-subunit alcohol dehydrogenase family)